MACHSCGIGFEHFTDSPSPLIGQEQGKKASCPTKEMMSKCMYSAQGVFVCSLDDPSVRSVADNTFMVRESVRDNKAFRNAAPIGME